MGMALEKDCELGWHISFRLAPGVIAKGIDPRAMLGVLANMGACRVIGRDDTSPGPSPGSATRDACQCPISWDMVLVGDATRAAIEHVFVDMPAAMELVIEPL